MKFKKIVLCLVSLIIPLLIFSQNSELKSIDEITNETEANAFVNSLNSFFCSGLKILTREQLREFKLRHGTGFSEETNLLKLSDSLEIKNYELLDFDNNGYTDILIRGDAGGLKTLLIMDMGNGMYEEKFLSQDEDILIKIGTLDNSSIIEYYYFDCNRTSKINSSLRKNILVYKFDEVLEYKSHNVKLGIKEIIFEAEIIYKSEPRFQMKINNKGLATIRANSYKYRKGDLISIDTKYEELNGTYTSKVENKSFDQLMEILEYLNFKEVRKNCMTRNNRSPFKIKIIYNDGFTINLHEYTNDLTFSLDYILKLIWDLRDKQKWIKDSK